MSARPRDRHELATALRDARRRLLAMIEDLSDAQLRVPPSPVLNPFLWEVGHAGWFHERFLLRGLGGRGPMHPEGDSLWDSIAIEHETRWDLPLPSREETLAYLREVHEAVLERLEEVELDEDEWNAHLLALYHEDMHIEAFAYMRQTMAYPPPRPEGVAPAGPAEEPCAGDVELEGGPTTMGAGPEVSFAFDNEYGAHEVEVRPFALARAPVTEGEYRAFVEDGGYERRELWSEEGWRWRVAVRAQRPRYWRREDGEWLRQAWNTWVPLEDRRPVSHVTAYEAEAYCRWAGRRLPTEAEWEHAARRAGFAWGEEECAPDRANLDFACGDLVAVDACAGGATRDGVRHMLGNLWEWTSTEFAPYPGFRPGRYREYSQPCFHQGHRVLRGGCWATPGRLMRVTHRNFWRPERGDVWCGFRTARDLDSA